MNLQDIPQLVHIVNNKNIWLISLFVKVEDCIFILKDHPNRMYNYIKCFLYINMLE